ncbi:hypothetical protein ACMAY5_00675 [Arenicellales bacterium nBUS_48]
MTASSPDLVADQILATLSSRERLNRKSFNELLQVLVDFSSHRNQAFFVWRTLRNLEALGHVEVDQTPSRQIRICAPALLKLPWFGRKAYLLSGRRGLDAVDEVRDSVLRLGIEIEIRSDRDHADGLGLIPERVILKGDTDEDFERLGEELNIAISHVTAAFAIAQNASSIDEYRGKLEFFDAARPNPYDQGFEPEIFSRNEKKFRKYQSGESRSACLLRYPENYGSQKAYFFYDSTGNYARVHQNWGRFLLLREKNSPSFVYMENDQQLLVPRFLQLPLIYDRALTLCSGFPSGGYPVDTSYITYRGIPPEMVKLLNEKLGKVQSR